MCVLCACVAGVRRYGKHLESVGDILGAVREYEAAKTHRTEVPRMLFNLRMFADLNAYIDSKADKVCVCAPRLGSRGSACGFVDTPRTRRLLLGGLWWASRVIDLACDDLKLGYCLVHPHSTRMCASFAAGRCQELGKWWAQFCESKGDFSTAVHYYNISEDALSLVCGPPVE
jgi:hypothetical protein